MKRCFCIPFTRVNGYEKMFLYALYTRELPKKVFLNTDS